MKRVLIIAAGIALVLLVNRLAQVSFYAGDILLETYVGMAALVFLLCGMYWGNRWQARRETTATPPPGNTEPLTLREIEVLRAAAEGLSNLEIAERLFISLPTVKSHLSSCYLKLEVKRRTQALNKAKDLKLI